MNIAVNGIRAGCWCGLSIVIAALAALLLTGCAGAAECLHSPGAAKAAHPGAHWARWSGRDPGHHGERCWYAVGGRREAGRHGEEDARRGRRRHTEAAAAVPDPPPAARAEETNGAAAPPSPPPPARWIMADCFEDNYGPGNRDLELYLLREAAILRIARLTGGKTP